MLDLEPIRKRLETATPGPWRVDEVTGDAGDCPDGEVISRGIDGPGGVGLNTGVEFQMYSPEDAQFIAHAPADIAALLGEVERLRNPVTITLPYPPRKDPQTLPDGHPDLVPPLGGVRMNPEERARKAEARVAELEAELNDAVELQDKMGITT